MIDKYNTRLLSICSSFRRPEILKGMLNSFDKTKSIGTEIFIYLHDDDPFLEQYKDVVAGRNYEIGIHRNLQQAINYVVFDLFPEIQYYQTVNDDFIYHTIGWDTILSSALEENAGGYGFSCGRHSVVEDWKRCKHPSAEVYSWKFVNAMGYVYPKNMEHACLDHFTKDISIMINGLVFVESVIIEHLWYGGCNKQKDINTIELYNDDVFSKAKLQYEFWRDNEKVHAFVRIAKAKGIKINDKYINRLPKDFGPKHPDWNIPSKRNTYLLAYGLPL